MSTCRYRKIVPSIARTIPAKIQVNVSLRVDVPVSVGDDGVSVVTADSKQRWVSGIEVCKNGVFDYFRWHISVS